jgi:5-methylcytosine-specific restriction endonuclease McrA
MPAINNSITFSAIAIAKITEVKREPEYSHTRWADDDLLEIRREIRDFYRREQRLTCAYCREVISVRAAACAPIEHIVSKSQYLQFMFEPKNLCVVCGDCNEFKGSRESMADSALVREYKRVYPSDSNKYRGFHPHLDDYEDHIIKAKFLYFNRSPKGSYTIYVCNLNRFVETFGLSQEFLDDLDTIAEQERFHGL